MRKLRVFFAIALVAALLPLNAFARYEEGDIVQDPKHPNIKREMIEEMRRRRHEARAGRHNLRLGRSGA